MLRVVHFYTVAAGILLLSLAGCAVTDIDHSANFKEYQTFTWGDTESNVKNPAYKGELIDKRIQSTVEKEFAKRGITLDPRNPDFIISYYTYTEKKQQATGGYYGYPYYGMRYFYPFGFWGYPFGWRTSPHTETFTEGTLIIDVTDAGTNELIWRGTVSGRLNNVAGLQKQLEKGIKAIMKKYPVTPDEPLPVKPDNIS